MSSVSQKRTEGLNRRHRRIRVKMSGTTERPRLAVRRTDKHIYAQLVDDDQSHTLAWSDQTKAAECELPEGLAGKRADAYRVGRSLAELARTKGIVKIVFDRNGYLYHGRVAALAQGARDGGLEF